MKEVKSLGAWIAGAMLLAMLAVTVIPLNASAAAGPESAPTSAVAPESSAPVDVAPASGTAPEEAAPNAGPTVSFGNLPHGLSPWTMYSNADAVVKTVILSLLFASLLTWSVWVAKSFELSTSRKTLRRALLELNEATGLPAEGAHKDPIVTVMVSAAHKELAQVTSGALATAGVTDRVVARLERIESAAALRANRGTSILASIGSTAPFVGLFGTVWGIMNSFIGISEAKTTNLVVVAPGIAEALLATAFGLIAAIPAVLFYNAFAKQITTYRALLVDAATYISCLVSREVDKRSVGAPESPVRHVAAVR